MTEATKPIERLDRAKPPPGYEIHEVLWLTCWHFRPGENEALSPCLESEQAALAGAWKFFETANDPPGMWSLGGAFGVRRRETHETSTTLKQGEGDARAAAWEHYWKCDELARRMEAAGERDIDRGDVERAEVWPDILLWPENLLAQATRDLAEVEAALAGEGEDA